MITLLTFSFISGLATILAPCIWPLLPIILSASSGGGRQRPLGISLGIISSFTLITLSISYLTKLIPLDPNLLRTAAVVIIMALGISMIFPSLMAIFEGWIANIIGPLNKKPATEKNGFGAGYWTGCSIGLIWAPCAGPILATVATLAALQAINGQVIAVAIAYALGLSIPLFLFALGGSIFFARMKRFNKYTGRIQQVFGVIMLLSAMLIYTNYDKIIQTRILDAFPAYSQLVSGWEQGDKVSHALSQLRQTRPQVEMAEGKPSQLPDLGPAAELTGISHWLNTSSPVSIASLKGKVILVDFWTYSCINCIRTLPHVTGWYEKYKDQGLVVIGVHTPEFAFEKKSANVALAIKQFGIHYPVAQDNDFRTWQAYQNQYWPAQYLIDARGRLRKTHFGEGEYDKMEQAIQALLQEAGQNITGKINQNTNKTSYHSRTPETYLGLARLERFASPEKPQSGLQRFTRPEKIKKDYFAYEGEWELLDEAAHPLKGAVLSLRFTGNKVFLVIGPQETSHNSLSVKLDGVIIPNELAGGDVHNGLVSLDTERLYELVALKGDSNSHLLQLEFNDASLKLYAFTFG